MENSSTPQNNFTPQYNKPDAPGIAMNFDNTVSLYQVVKADDTFDDAAQKAFELLLEAQQRYPGWPRIFYVDVEGHEGEQSGFDADLFEFQQDFWFSTVAHFVTAFDVPMLGGLINPNKQRDDIPDALQIGDSTESDAVSSQNTDSENIETDTES